MSDVGKNNVGEYIRFVVTLKAMKPQRRLGKFVFVQAPDD
jgi:hypothetical protein